MILYVLIISMGGMFCFGFILGEDYNRKQTKQAIEREEVRKYREWNRFGRDDQ